MENCVATLAVVARLRTVGPGTDAGAGAVVVADGRQVARVVTDRLDRGVPPTVSVAVVEVEVVVVVVGRLRKGPAQIDPRAATLMSVGAGDHPKVLKRGHKLTPDFGAAWHLQGPTPAMSLPLDT